MKTGLKRSGKSNSKPPSRSKEKSTDKPAPTSSKTTRNSRATAIKPTSKSASRKTKSTSPKAKSSADASKSRPPSAVRATRNSASAKGNKANDKTKSQSPKSKSTSRPNTSKPPSKPNTPKNQLKKPAVKPTSTKDTPKTKKQVLSKSPHRSAPTSPKRSESPEKDTEKTKGTKKGKAAQKPKSVQVKEAKRSSRAKDKKSRDAESRSRSAPQSPKGKASPSMKKGSAHSSPKKSPEKVAGSQSKMEVVGEMDLLVPDPVSEFIRDSEGHLVQMETEQDSETRLMINLEEILDDENYAVVIKMANTEPSRKSGAREEQKVQKVQKIQKEQNQQVPKEAAEEEDGYFVMEYTLFEDWRLLEASLAYKEEKGTRGLGSRKIWQSMLDPATGELLFGGRRTMRSMVNRYSLFIAHLSEAEQQMIQELGNSLPEHRMRRLKGQYSKASGQNRLLGIVEQIYDAPAQSMWLNPSTTRSQNVKPVTIEEFVKKSVDKTLGRSMEVEEEEEEKVLTTSRSKKAASKASKEKKEKPQQKRSVSKESKEKLPEKRSTSKGSKEKLSEKRSVSKESKEKLSEKRSTSKGSREKASQKRSISRDRVRDLETERMLIAQRNYLKLKELQAARVREEEDTNEQRKKFKNSAGKEVTILADDNRRRQVQEPQQPEKKLTKKEKAQVREQRRNEQELKQLKDTWVYDANSLSLSEVFSARKPISDIAIDPTLSLYVDFDQGFRQFVRDMGIKRSSNRVDERDMKWARLAKYAKEYGIPLSEVISIFNRVSCDNQDLELFLNSGDDGLLWTDQEDRDLLNNDQIAMRYLVKIKGPLRIKKRREFLLKLT